MHRFRRILVGVNVERGERQAYQQALQLSQLTGAHLTVVDVMRELPSFLHTLLADPASFRQQQHHDRLHALRDWVAGEVTSVGTKVLHGRTTHCLVREVLDGQHDLLVRDAHVDAGMEFLFGGVELRILRNCPCPVWLVKPGHDGRYDRVLAAIDCQPTPQCEAMNARILEMAGAFAAAHGSELHVVSAWQGPDDHGFDLGNWATASHEQVETVAWETLQRMVLPEGGPTETERRVHFRRGNAGDVILAIATELAADLVVMGTLARSGIPGLLIGNTAERVLRRVRCSVLAIKPHDFVSPISPSGDDEVSDFSPAWSPA